VLCSSIFFIADSVLRGYWMVRNWSMRGRWGTDLRGYLGLRASLRVVGRWKETVVRTLRAVCEAVPFSAAFLAAFALASWGFAAAEMSAVAHAKLRYAAQNPPDPTSSTSLPAP
jgi:uncharacterized membrane protein HdeD (DUF308 family)